MPSKTGGGYNALRVKRFRELIWNVRDPPTKKENDRMCKNILKLVDASTGDEIFRAFRDDSKFWEYLVTIPQCFDDIINKMSWQQVLEVLNMQKDTLSRGGCSVDLGSRSVTALWMVNLLYDVTALYICLDSIQ
jgi:hypothetical protein